MAGPYVGFDCVIQQYITDAYYTIGAVRDISGPSMTTTAVDVSTRAAKARAFMPSMRDNGEMTFDILYDPDNAYHAAAVTGGLVKLQQDGTVGSWQLLFPTATTIEYARFNAFVTGFAVKASLDDALTADLTIKIAGEVTWHAP